MSYLALFACLAAGFAAGKLLKLPGGWRKAIGVGLPVCLFVMVFLLGVKLGANADVLGQASSIGLRALVLAVCATGGSVLLAMGYRLLRRGKGGGQ